MVKNNTKQLLLSGTPFNISKDFDDTNTYTWDYISEQRAKRDWYDNIKNIDRKNPYEELPQLNIVTYDITGIHPQLVDSSMFTLNDFFEVVNGRFKYEENVKSFLDLLSKHDNNNSFPYSTRENKRKFRHTVWCLPGVEEAKCMSTLMENNSHFDMYKVINVAGNDVDTYGAKNIVVDAINECDNDNKYHGTITLTCRRLTVGVTIPEWSAVLMLTGGDNTSAAQYLQTIFRVQSPSKIGIKENAYVYDFAPDRSLKMITTAISENRCDDNTDISSSVSEFLAFCPIYDGNICDISKVEYSADYILTKFTIR